MLYCCCTDTLLLVYCRCTADMLPLYCCSLAPFLLGAPWTALVGVIDAVLLMYYWFTASVLLMM